MRYSPSTKQFYPEIGYMPADIPEDVVTVSHEEMLAVLDRTPQQDYDYIDGALVVFDKPGPSLAVRRESIANQIRSLRDSKKEGGIKIVIGEQDFWFHSDQDSRIQFLGLKNLAYDAKAEGATADTILTTLGQNLVWKTMAGTWVPVTVKLAYDLVKGISELDATLFAVAEGFINAVYASDTPETAVPDYATNPSWPEAYVWPEIV